MKTIKLTQDKIAQVDDKDFAQLNRFKWCHHQGYATRNLKMETILMHRIILNCPIELEVDHEDGNGLNNQRYNLRIATRSQNKANQPKQKGTWSSKYKGVSWAKHAQKWSGHIQVNKKQIHLGLFDSELAAHMVYRIWAKKFFGRFAKF